MSPDRNDLEARVTSLEQRLTVVSAESRAAYAFACALDHDVSVLKDKLNGHTRVLNALRETQLEQGNMLREHGERLDRLERVVEEGFAEMRQGFATVGAGMAQITALLTGGPGSDRG